jgi:ribosome maturation factor RimP
MSRDREARITQLVSEILADTEFELVDLEITGQARRTVLRVYIDKEPGGVTHGDCARVTRTLGDHLDAEPAIGLNSYVLEVSSPGIDRPLRKLEDFARFRGETAQVTTRVKIDGRTHHLGVIQDVLDDSIVLDQPDLGRTEIAFGDIQKAILRRDPWAEAKRRR